MTVKKGALCAQLPWIYTHSLIEHGQTFSSLSFVLIQNIEAIHNGPQVCLAVPFNTQIPTTGAKIIYRSSLRGYYEVALTITNFYKSSG